MRITYAAICLLFIAGCGGGTSDQPGTASLASEKSNLVDRLINSVDEAKERLEEAKQRAEEEVDRGRQRATRAVYDNAVLAFNKARTQSEFDKVGDALLKL